MDHWEGTEIKRIALAEALSLERYATAKAAA